VFRRALAEDCPLNIDCEIAVDPELRPKVIEWARDQNAFFQDFQKAYQKLQSRTVSELDDPGFTLNIPVHANLLAEGVAANAQRAIPNRAPVTPRPPRRGPRRD
jgi:catalase (peroxidase I)